MRKPIEGEKQPLPLRADVTRLQPEDFKKFPEAEDEEADLLAEAPGCEETYVRLPLPSGRVGSIISIEVYGGRPC